MDKLLVFTLNRTAKITAMTDHQKDKLMINILLTVLQKYMKKERINKQNEKNKK